MSKSKQPQPARRNTPAAPPEPKPVQSESPVSRPQAGERVPFELKRREDNPFDALASRPSAAPHYSARAQYCPAKEDSFNELAKQMQENGWELVAVVPHERFVSGNGSAGISKGWMSFWKKPCLPSQAKEEKSA